MSSSTAGTELDHINTVVASIASLERQVPVLLAEQAELVHELELRLPDGFPEAAREES